MNARRPSPHEKHAAAPRAIHAQDAGRHDQSELSLRVTPRRRMRRRLRRLLATMLAVQAAVAALTLLLLQGPLRAERPSDHAQSLADLIASRLVDQPIFAQNSLVQAALDEAAELSHVKHAAVIDAGGRVLAASTGEGDGLDALDPSQRRARLSGRAEIASVPASRGFTTHQRLLTPQGEEPRYLVVTVRDLAAQRVMLDGAIAVAVGGAVTALLPLPFTLFRFRRWTRGLHQLHTSIRRLATNAALRPAPVSGDDEIAYLSIAFNEMASAINASRRRLLEANQTLEQRVADRTEELRIANLALEKQNGKLEELTETALRFTDDVAHEFRTPLAVVIEFAEIMNDGIGGNLSQEHTEYVGFIANASRDLSSLVDDFLDSGRLRARSLRVDRRSHHASDVLDGVWPMLEARAAAMGIELVREIEPQTPRVFADAEKAGRSIANLTINALKFSGSGSQVVVRAAPDAAGAVRISVADQGPGLSEDDAGALFERFQQTNSGQRASAKGFGLGLSIVSELVALNLGAVSVESEPGVGSVFSFTLPPDDPHTIIEMFTARARDRQTADDIGALRASLVDPSMDLDAAHTLLAQAGYPTDVQLALPDRSVLLIGETSDPARWRERLLEQTDQSCAPVSIDEIERIDPSRAQDRLTAIYDELSRDQRSAAA